MATRSLPEIVVDETLDVLGELGDWLRLAPACPKCGALQGCSHQAGCPLGRVARLRCLLGSGDQKRRDDELVALRRERGWPGTPEADGPMPALLASAAAPAHAASDVRAATPAYVEPGAPTVGTAGAT